jgi:predicted flavoprotein YhiN
VRSRGSAAPQRLEAQWTELDAPAWDEALRLGAGTLGGLLGRHLQERLAGALLAEAGLASEQALARLARTDRRRLVELLTACPLPWTGDEGYAKAEVTGGGVALGDIDPRTLASRRHPGLFLCGELLDAFGPIGGHNFAWAWATGRAAGIAAGEHARGAGSGPSVG